MEYRRRFDGKSDPPSDYPPIPSSDLFFSGYGYERPVEIHYYCWRTDYERWGACVTFANGWHGVTSMKDWE